MFSIGEKVRVKYDCSIPNCSQCFGIFNSIAIIMDQETSPIGHMYRVRLEDGRIYKFYSGELKKLEEITYESGF